MKLVVPSLIAASMIVVFAGLAEAEQGKRISTGEALSVSPVAAFPALSDALTVPVPKAYKSKSNFLKVTTTYQAGCSAGDSLGSRISIDGQVPQDSTFPFEAFNEDAAFQMVTKVYFFDSEAAGGPAIAPGSSVTLQLASSTGTGCGVSAIRMVVEALK